MEEKIGVGTPLQDDKTELSVAKIQNYSWVGGGGRRALHRKNYKTYYRSARVLFFLASLEQFE